MISDEKEKRREIDMDERWRENDGRVKRIKEMCAGVSARGFEGSKKSEQGKQDLLSYRSVLSTFIISSSNIYNAT